MLSTSKNNAEILYSGNLVYFSTAISVNHCGSKYCVVLPSSALVFPY